MSLQYSRTDLGVAAESIPKGNSRLSLNARIRGLHASEFDVELVPSCRRGERERGVRLQPRTLKTHIHAIEPAQKNQPIRPCDLRDFA